MYQVRRVFTPVILGDATNKTCCRLCHLSNLKPGHHGRVGTGRRSFRDPTWGPGLPETVFIRETTIRRTGLRTTSEGLDKTLAQLITVPQKGYGKRGMHKRLRLSDWLVTLCGWTVFEGYQLHLSLRPTRPSRPPSVNPLGFERDRCNTSKRIRNGSICMNSEFIWKS